MLIKSTTATLTAVDLINISQLFLKYQDLLIKSSYFRNKCDISTRFTTVLPLLYPFKTKFKQFTKNDLWNGLPYQNFIIIIIKHYNILQTWIPVTLLSVGLSKPREQAHRTQILFSIHPESFSRHQTFKQLDHHLSFLTCLPKKLMTITTWSGLTIEHIELHLSSTHITNPNLNPTCWRSHLDFAVLHDALCDDIAHGTVKLQAPDSAQEEARVSVHRAQEAVDELLCAGEHPPEVIILAVAEDAREPVEGENAEDLVIDVRELKGETVSGLIRLRRCNEDHVIAHEKYKLVPIGMDRPDEVRSLGTVLEERNQGMHRTHQRRLTVLVSVPKTLFLCIII